MAKLAELHGRMATIIKDLEELRDVEDRTDEQEARADELINELNDIGPKIAKQRSLESVIGENKPLTESRGRVSGINPIFEGGKRVDQDEYKSLGLRVYDSEGLEELRAKKGNGLATFNFESFHEERQAAEQRAIANTVILPSGYVQPQRVPGIFRGQDQFGSLRDVLLSGTATEDTINFFKESAFTNNAAEVAEATATTGSSGSKPESAISFAPASASAGTIAHWIPVTKQMIWNAPEMQSYIEGRLIDGLKLREDAELLNGNGTAPNIRGLLNTSGIQVLDGTYFTANPVVDAGTSGNERFNRVARAKTNVATVGRAIANFIALNPADLEKFQTTTDAQKQYFGGGPLAAGVPTTIWGMRVVVNENLAAGTALVGDGRCAQIWDRLDASVQVGYINDQFTRNMFTLLAEERLILTVYRPEAFAKVTLV